jgi:hypothetical protein
VPSPLRISFFNLELPLFSRILRFTTSNHTKKEHESWVYPRLAYRPAQGQQTIKVNDASQFTYFMYSLVLAETLQPCASLTRTQHGINEREYTEGRFLLLSTKRVVTGPGMTFF